MEAADQNSLLDALSALRDELARARLGLDVPDVDRARAVRNELVGQIDDYLLPRLSALDAPLLAVIGGSTGAGKSTLINSLVGVEVSAAGVLRPTTRAPVLICHPDDVGSFEGERVLPRLPRITGPRPDEGPGLHLVPHDSVPAGLALLDAPDIDSIVTGNRELGEQLLAAADLWLFLTTAARYADAVPWELLDQARARSTALALVLNRVPPEAMRDVPEHLGQLLSEHGLGGAPLFVIEESELQRGLLPEPAVAPIRTWLEDLAANAEERARVVRTTLEGALDSLDERVGTVTAHVGRQIAAARALRGGAHDAYERARDEIGEALASGSLLRGEVLARWHDVVGTGDFMRSLESRIGWFRDRIRASLFGETAPATEVRTTLAGSVETVVLSAAQRAALRAADEWRALPAGRRLLSGRERALETFSSELPQAVRDEIHEWQGYVLELVRAEGSGRRAAARAASLGVNALGAALMVAVFAQTGGLTGGELLVAGGTATVSQRLLEAIFGDQAVRVLAVQARTDLLKRVDRLLEGERARFDALLADAAAGPDETDALRRAVQAVRVART